jgi:hypothetical protein
MNWVNMFIKSLAGVHREFNTSRQMLPLRERKA